MIETSSDENERFHALHRGDVANDNWNRQAYEAGALLIFDETVVTLLTTTGTVRAVRDLGSFFSGTFHFNDSPETFSIKRWFSAKSHPERCGSCPKVSPSAEKRNEDA
ncbi:MAG: hypothetical protein EXQ58_05430 [Acidobacteria bacterium]|nr:hypothetical protein [Acidobacteriota bacterium]